ncbi:MAG: hypothetical protein ABFS86_16485 [Planctomycetota bacterium]
MRHYPAPRPDEEILRRLKVIEGRLAMIVLCLGFICLVIFFGMFT